MQISAIDSSQLDLYNTANMFGPAETVSKILRVLRRKYPGASTIFKNMK
jgi:hypothetical protein